MRPHLLNRLAAALAASMCLAPSAYADVELQDDAGQRIRLAQPARRIVSLAPHVTELLFAAGAGDRVVGAVDYSDYPPAARKLPRVGGYSNIDMEAVAALKPDLVIAWKSGNRDAHLDRLSALGIPVFISEPHSLDDVARSLENLGKAAGSDREGRAAADAFRQRKRELARRYADRPPVRMFYEIWDKPLMTVNDEHLISDVMRLCGGVNVFGKLDQLAPTIGVEGVLAANPEVIVASGMGEARPDWLDMWKRWPRLAAVTSDNLYFVPPELIQRHTPRILEGASMLCEQLDTARRKRRSGG
ncbi:cobalamin-binding protein [Azoarcus sp. KH32C]|uniref:cobalamin-binding protein n=1 Tax=Azoarcus sp. KH32C TaxID=748247 RepID=UPI00023868A7|nr:cobalamin-binding protein [Azoarcus sp. KH32C]BAL26431.1 substrate-binding periplasmic (PBP) ABC transporter protein [Azoarcus sp. KH32C]